MKQFWLRLISRTPKWAKCSQLFFGSVAVLGGSLLILDTAPEWVKYIAEKLAWVGGSIAAFSQFIVSSLSKHNDKINTK